MRQSSRFDSCTVIESILAGMYHIAIRASKFDVWPFPGSYRFQPRFVVLANCLAFFVSVPANVVELKSTLVVKTASNALCTKGDNGLVTEYFMHLTRPWLEIHIPTLHIVGMRAPPFLHGLSHSFGMFTIPSGSIGYL